MHSWCGCYMFYELLHFNDNRMHTLLVCVDAIAVRVSGFGGGDGPVFLRDVRCVGTEGTLLECGGTTVGIQDCGGHRHDAGVYCGCKCHHRLEATCMNMNIVTVKAKIC